MNSKRTFAFIIWDFDGVYKISSQELQNTPSLFPSCPSLCTLVWLCINPSGIHLKSSLGSFIWSEMLVLLVSIFLLFAMAMLARLLLTLLKINSVFVCICICFCKYSNLKISSEVTGSLLPLSSSLKRCSSVLFSNLQICKYTNMQKMQNVLQSADMQKMPICKKWKMFSNLQICKKCKMQTWNLSKILHNQIFLPKFLHTKNAWILNCDFLC